MNSCLGDLHFYMRHSFKAAPPADPFPEKSFTNFHAREKAQANSLTQTEAKRKTPHVKAEDSDGFAAHEKKAVANGMNGHSRSHQLGGSSWKSVTEEALRKLQGSMSTDPRPSSASPAVSSASVTGLSRSASFASLDSQPHLEGTAHKGMSNHLAA